jgi:opacity protein-like surface antigen
MGRIALLALAAVGVLLPGTVNAQWYIRGDTGWSMSRDAGGNVNDDVGSSVILGAGLGYRVNKWIRVDVTGAYRPGYEIDTNTSAAGTTGTFKGDVTSLAAMANIYVDLVTWGRFTPYVGGGIGGSQNSMDDIALNVGGVTGTLEGGDSRTSFAWNAAAGVGIEVMRNMLIDFGYRYVDLGEAKSGNGGTLGGAAFSTSAPVKADLKAHEIQAGVRIGF